MHVSKYNVTRHYGGPEEGGWWYDVTEYVDTLHSGLTPEDARQKVNEFNDLAKTQKRQPSGNYQGRYSMANNTDEVYMAENTRGQYDTTKDPRPHYS